jgi:arylsulfatase A-like enzyme
MVSACRTPPPVSQPSVFLAEHLSSADKIATSAAASEFHSESWTLGGETRLAMVTPLASRIAYTVNVPDEPELSFATALFPLADEISQKWTTLRSAEFRVRVVSDDTDEIVFAHTVRRHQAGGWINHTVNLAPWARQTIRLELEVEPPARFLRAAGDLRSARAQYLPLWGNPVVGSKKQATDVTTIILISMDCVRADHVGVYGYEAGSTPNIDAFALDGVVFEEAMTTAPSTLPSHTSMFTGLTPLFHGANKWRARAVNAPYLPTLLSSRGFEVHGVVTAPYLSQVFGFEEGFHSYTFMFDARAGDAVDAAIAVIDRWSSRPQFMFLHLFDAHAPYLPPQSFLPDGKTRAEVSTRMRRAMSRGGPPTSAENEELIELYDGEIGYLDHELGRFFDELRSRGIYDRALILLTADHGEAFHEHGHGQHSRTLYEEITHVPLIVKWPFDSPRGATDALASHIDILPTILEQANLPDRPNVPDMSDAFTGMGLSLRSLAAGPKLEGRTVMSELEWLLDTKTLMKIAVRREDLKYIATLDSAPDEDTGLEHLESEELYFLDDDPGELTNLASTNVEVRDRMRELLGNYLKTVGAVRSASERIELDETTRRQLESLGYVYN